MMLGDAPGAAQHGTSPINSMGTSWERVEALLFDQSNSLPPRPLKIDTE